jgi:hypothetical protein
MLSGQTNCIQKLKIYAFIVLTFMIRDMSVDGYRPDDRCLIPYKVYFFVLLAQTGSVTHDMGTGGLFTDADAAVTDHRPIYNTRVYPKVSGLAAWSENCKRYSSLPLGAVVSLFCESV